MSTINRSGPGGDEGVYLLEIPRARQLPGIRRLWVYSLAPWPVNPALLGRTQLELHATTQNECREGILQRDSFLFRLCAQ